MEDDFKKLVFTYYIVINLYLSLSNFKKEPAFPDQVCFVGVQLVIRSISGSERFRDLERERDLECERER